LESCGNTLFNGKVKKLGCPSVENFSVTNNSVSPDIVSSLIDMANEISNPVKQKSIRDLASFSLVGAKRKEFLALEKDKIIDMLQSLISSAYIQEALPILSSHVLSSLDSSGIMTELLQKTVDVHFWNDEDIDRDLFVATFNTNLDYRSLIPLIALTSFRSHRPNLLLELDQSAFMEQSDDPDIVLSGIWTLQILMDGFDKNRAAANLATSASEGVKTSEIFLNYLCYISRAHRIDIDISILSNIYKIVNDGNERVAIILGAELKRILDRRSSALFEGGRWVERYNLPEECADFVEKQ
jgi:hypothetical protein